MRISDWSSDVCSSDLVQYVLRKDGNGVNGEKGGEDEAHGVTPDYCASVIARLAVPAKAIFAEFPLPSCRTCSGIQRCSRTTAYIAWHDVGPRNKSGVTASRRCSFILFILQPVGADPRHLCAQFAADCFYRMLCRGLEAGLGFGLAGRLVEAEFLVGTRR